MNDATDKSIIAAIIAYPDITDEECCDMTEGIGDPSCKKAMQAYLGMIPQEQLDDMDRHNLREIHSWERRSKQKIEREQKWHRMAGRETPFSAHLKKRHAQGHVGEKLLQSTGVTGLLPPRATPLTEEEKEARRFNATFSRFVYVEETGILGEMHFKEFVPDDPIKWQMEGF
jgi:hypothetical protein